MIALADTRPIPMLLCQLERRLKEVHEQARRGIQRRQQPRRGDTLQALIAHGPTDDRAVLLLDPGLIVLPIGAAAGEPYSRLQAVVADGLVDKHGVVVRVESAQYHGQPSPQLMQHGHEQGLLPHQERAHL